MKKILLTSSIFFLHFLLPYYGIAQKYVIKTYTIEDGLPQTQVDDICQDSFGYIWVATRGGGLGKFDGSTFTTYKTKNGLPSNLITNIIWGKDRRLWIGTFEGLSVFDGKRFKNYNLAHNNVNKSITALAEDALGNIWVATSRGGVYRFSNATITYFGAKGGFTDKIVRKITYDPHSKRIWFCTSGDGLKYFEKGAFFNPKRQFLESIPSIITLLHDENRYLIGTRSGLYQLNKSDSTLEKVHSVKNQMILDIKKDASGNIWLGTDTGISKIQNDQVEILDHHDGIVPVPVKKIFEDKEGIVWFSGDNLKSSSTMNFKKIDVSDGLPQATVMTLNFDNKENLWAGMIGGGISKIKTEGSRISLENFNLSEVVFCGIIENNGTPWFGTSSGLYKYQDQKFVFYDLKNLTPHPVFESVYKDKEGKIWWGSFNNILRYENGVFKNFALPESGNSAIIRCFQELSSGTLLIGGSNGLYKFENESIVKVDIPNIPTQSIMNILEDREGIIWMGLYGDGILRWNPNDNSVKIYTEEDGLTSNLVYCLIFDDFGRLWAGSEKGIDALYFEKDHTLKHVKNFGKHEGFQGIETNHNAITKDKKGNIWIGTVKGIFTFNPRSIDINTTPPRLALTKIKLYHETPDWSKFANFIEPWHSIPRFVEVPYNKNHFTFLFQAISFQNPQKVYYSYKLLNFDEKWSPVSQSREAVYANLPPGNYTFMVRAQNEDGIWNREAVNYAFTIKPPIWMRWWFYVIVILVFLLLSKIIYNFLVQRKLRRVLKIEKIKAEEAEKIRKIVAKDFHDEMGNHLASISVLVQLLKRKSVPLSIELDEIVEKIDKSSRTLFNGTKNFIWSIDPKNDKLYEVLLYLKDFGEDLFDNTDINFYMDINHLRNACLKLPPGWSRHIVLIIKEALTNCLKHANCLNVWVFVKLEGTNFKITIRDDGIGFNMENVHTRQNNIGLENMKFRASKIKCRLGIKRGTSKGTELVLDGDLQNNQNTSCYHTLIF